MGVKQNMWKTGRACVLVFYYGVAMAQTDSCANLAGRYAYYGTVLSCANSGGACSGEAAAGRADFQIFGFSAGNVVHPRSILVERREASAFFARIEEPEIIYPGANNLSALFHPSCSKGIWRIDGEVFAGGGERVRSRSVSSRSIRKLESGDLHVTGRVDIFDMNGAVLAWSQWESQFKLLTK